MPRLTALLTALLGVALVSAAVGAQSPVPGVQQPARDTSAQKVAPPVPAGVIAGRVVAADTGRPIKRARVLASAPELPDARGVLTDDDGAYELSALPAGRYSIHVSKAGFISLAYGQRRPLQAGTPLQLGDGQQLKGVDFRLPKGGVVSGHILDENSDPMVGAMVRVLRYEYMQGDRRMVPVGTAQTDDRGEYRVWGLNPGDYYVSVLVRDFGGGRFRGPRGFGGGNIAAFMSTGGEENEPLGYAPTYYPGTTSAGDARTVTVGLSQEVLGIDFNVQLVRTARVSGRVVNPDGSPTSSGSVSLVPDGVRSQAAITYGARIDWDGAFAIPSVPPGRYLVRARGNDAETPQYASAPVTVAGADMTINLALAASATLTGMVVFQGQQTVAGNPGSIRISAVPADQAPFGPTPNARVEKNGRFTLDGIASGAHFIRSANAPRGWALKSVTIDGRDVTDTPIEVRSGQSVGGAVVTFTNNLTQISGTVTDGNGNPVTDDTVLAFPLDTSLWRPLSRQIMTTRPDQNGHYVLRGLPPGEYYVATVDPAEAGEWFEPAFLDEQRVNAARVSLTEGDAKTQDFRIAVR